MPNIQELFLSLLGHVPAPRAGRLTNVASRIADAVTRPRAARKGQAPPIFLGNNRLRQDIGLPPVDERGLPL